MANETIRGFQNIIDADAKADLLNHFVGIFCVDIVYYTLRTGFLKIFGRDLDQIGDGSLKVRISTE